MSNNTQKILLIFFITAQAVTACYGSNMEAMCTGELEINRFGRGKDNSIREFVLPDSGLYERYRTDKKFDALDPNELIALEAIEDPFRSPAYATPLFIVLDEAKKTNDKQHILALCVAGQEFLPPPYMDDYAASIVDSTYFSKFTKLKHLELYSINPLKGSFSEIAKISNLEYLGMHRLCKDSELKYLASLSKLTFLNLSGTNITGEGLKFLAKLDQLKTLDLRGTTELNGSTLGYLKSCRNLETILLSDTQTDDNDLKFLVGIKNLKYLTLHRTEITDAGLKVLAELKGLKYVSLYDTKTSEAGRNLLRQNNADIVLRLKRPQSLNDFLLDGLFVRALSGDYSAQLELVDTHLLMNSYGKKFVRDNKEEDLKSLLNKADTAFMPRLITNDSVEALSWIFVVKDRQPRVNYLNPSDYLIRKMAELEAELSEELNVVELNEAKRRSRVYLYLSEKVSHEFKIERQPGLPVYQYDFNWLGGKSVDEFRRELHIQSLESYIEKRKDKLDKDKLELLKNKLKELKKEVKE